MAFLPPPLSYEQLLALAPPRGTLLRDEPEVVLDPGERTRILTQLATAAALPDTHPLLQSGILHRDRDVTLVRDVLAYPDGHFDIRSRMLYTGAEGPVAGVALLPVVAGKIGLVRQWRNAASRWTLEAMRGRLASPSEDPAMAVERELLEEMGATRDGDLIPLGRVTPESGYISGVCMAFLAPVRNVAQPTTPDEGDMFRAPRWLVFSALQASFVSGELVDAITLAVLARAVAQGVLPATIFTGAPR